MARERHIPVDAGFMLTQVEWDAHLLLRGRSLPVPCSTRRLVRARNRLALSWWASCWCASALLLLYKLQRVGQMRREEGGSMDIGEVGCVENGARFLSFLNWRWE